MGGSTSNFYNSAMANKTSKNKRASFVSPIGVNLNQSAIIGNGKAIKSTLQNSTRKKKKVNFDLPVISKEEKPIRKQSIDQMNKDLEFDQSNNNHDLQSGEQ